MNPFEIVIGCHTKSFHAELFIEDSTAIASLKSSEWDPHVQYVQSSAGWSTIPSNSAKIIWLENCPIYGFLKNPKQASTDFMNIARDLNLYAWNILQNNGSIMVPLPDDIPDIEDIKSYFTKPWKYKVISSNQSDFYIGKIKNETVEKRNRILVMTKANTGGKRKTRRTKKRVLRYRKN